MVELHDLLENLKGVEGVTGVFLLDSEGNIFDSAADNPADIDYIADMVYCCVDSGRQIADSIMNSPLKQSHVEFSDSSLILDLFTNGTILALMTSAGANLGRIRMEIRRIKKDIEKFLS